MSVRIRVALVAILATVLAANAGATIYAAATASTIKACVKSSGTQKGLMRYLASGSCASGEKLLAWNVTGPQGPTGPAGPAGGNGGSAGPAPYWVSEWRPEPIFPSAPAKTELRFPQATYLVGLQLELWSDTSAVATDPAEGELALTVATCTVDAGSKQVKFERRLYEGWAASVSYDVVVTGSQVSVTCSQKTTSKTASRAAQFRLGINGLVTATPIAVQ